MYSTCPLNKDVPESIKFVINRIPVPVLCTSLCGGAMFRLIVIRNLCFALALLSGVLGRAVAQENRLPPCPWAIFTWTDCVDEWTASNGRKYVGAFKDNKFHGHGTMTYPDGSKYVGEFKNDKRNGQGTETFLNGNKYVGEYVDGKRNGHFTVTFANGHTYFGEMKDDQYNGHGTFTFANGVTYVGEFRNSKYNGHGIEYRADGSIRRAGIWESGNLVKSE